MTTEQREAIERLKSWRENASKPHFAHPYFGERGERGWEGDKMMRQDTWIVACLCLDMLAARETIEDAHA